MLNSDILTLIALGLAVFVIFKLRSVLGQRTGTERPPQDLFSKPSPAEAGESNVVPLPGAGRRDMATATPEPEVRLAGLVSNDSPAFAGLVELMRADASFDPREFVGGARAAYEMIVLAFAQGDRNSLKDLLSKDVYDGFEAAIRDRESRGERVETQFVSVDKADIYGAALRGRSAQVTIRFLSKLITATRNASGAVIDGSAEKVVDVNDIWTFARDISTRDPNWRLIATESTQ